MAAAAMRSEMREDFLLFFVLRSRSKIRVKPKKNLLFECRCIVERRQLVRKVCHRERKMLQLRRTSNESYVTRGFAFCAFAAL